MSNSFLYPQSHVDGHAHSGLIPGLCSTSSSLTSFSSISSNEQGASHDSDTDEDGDVVAPNGVSTQIRIQVPSPSPFLTKRTPNTTPILEKGGFFLGPSPSPCPRSWGAHTIPTLRISPATTPASSPNTWKGRRRYGGIIGQRSTRQSRDLATLYNALIAVTLVGCMFVAIATTLNLRGQHPAKEGALNASLPSHHHVAQSTLVEDEQQQPAIASFQPTGEPEAKLVYTERQAGKSPRRPEGLEDESQRTLGRYAGKLGLWRLSDVGGRFGSPSLTSFGKNSQAADTNETEHGATDSSAARRPGIASETPFVIHTPPTWLSRRRRWGQLVTDADEGGEA